MDCTCDEKKCLTEGCSCVNCECKYGNMSS